MLNIKSQEEECMECKRNKIIIDYVKYKDV